MDIFKQKDLTSTEAAYLAGCIDCDGSISIEVGKQKSTKMNIVSVNKSYLELIKDIASCGHIYRTSKLRSIGKYIAKEAFEWHVSSKKYLLPLLESIYPYMLLKKDKVLSAIKILKAKRNYRF